MNYNAQHPEYLFPMFEKIILLDEF